MVFNYKIKYILIFFVIILFSVHSEKPFAQNNQIKFKHITLEDGLSQSSVSCILQDYRGFMWFGTLDGLNKYDGYNITIYRNNAKDSLSLPDNSISVLFEDFSKNLWIGTHSKGLLKYDRIKNRFLNIHSFIRNQSNSIKNSNILSLVQDYYGTLWIGTEKGLKSYNATKNKVFDYNLWAGFSENAASNSINSLVLERNSLWVATNNGLYKMDILNKKFKKWSNDSPSGKSLTSNHINTLYLDERFTLWIGTSEGLYYKKSTEEEIRPYISADQSYTLDKVVVTSIAKATGNKLWIGTEKYGMNKIDTRTGDLQRYMNDPSNQSSLTVNNILSIYEDKANILWVGTQLGGVNKWNRAAEGLNIYRNNPYDPNSLSSSQVRSIYEDREGLLWIGTVDGGLNEWIPAENRFVSYVHKNEDQNSLSHDHVRTMLEDHEGIFWIGTDGGGINIFDKKKHTFKHIRADKKNGSLSSDKVWKIYEDTKDRIWVATNDGLNLYDRKTKQFKVFRHDDLRKYSIADNAVTTIYEDRHHNMWIGTYGGGLDRYVEFENKFYHYKHTSSQNSLGTDRVYCIYEDSHRMLWVGTKGSLSRYNPFTNDFKVYTELEKFPNDVILGILEDKSGRLWLSTNKGLIRFDPMNNKIRNYDVRDGMQSNEFLVGSCCRTRQGQLLFGGINGFNAFYPEKLKENSHKPDLVIVNFKILNNEIVLDSAISEKRHLKLEYDQNNFSFEFVGLDYMFPEKNQYAYRLEGYENIWNRTGNMRVAKYTNLQPGTYVFRVIGSNNDEVWNSKGVSLIVEIIPAFWQTNWFKFGIGLFILVSLVLFVYLRIRTIHKRNEHLEELVQIRTAEITLQSKEIESQSDEIKAQRDDLEQQRDIANQQNKEILDSIYYAKRIQKATLPDLNFLEDYVHSYFVLLRPKNIVSGDFYWSSYKDGKLIIVAADCTGHGVPGAFMSMFGVSFLNRIVNERGIVYPTDILNTLRDNIISSLKQKGVENEAHDGMDIALCAYDPATKVLQFAGANNPLVYISDNQLNIVDADDMPIGIYDKMDEFETHEIQMSEGDVVYLFSDGYGDQFGGPKQKKYKSQRFKKFLHTISEHHLELQKNMLSDEFDQWMGNNEQVDDILVFGIKL